MKNPSISTYKQTVPLLRLKYFLGFILCIGSFLFLAPAEGQVAFRSSSQAFAADQDKTLDVGKPAGLQIGDVMVAGISVRPYNVNIIGVPTGWSFLRSISAGSSGSGGDNLQAIYYKIVDATDLLPTTTIYTWKFNQSEGSVGGIIAFSGVETNYGPIDKHAGATSGSTTTLTFSSPSISTTYNDEAIVGFHAYGSSGTWTNPVGATFPMLQKVDIASHSVPYVYGESMEMSYGIKITAGATGSVSATASNDPEVGVSQIVALIPKTTITYPGSPYCKNEGTATPNLIGITGGKYSSNGGLPIDVNSGAVDLANSTAGTYLVTYKYGTSLQYFTTTTIVINTVPTATISGATSICEDASSPNISFTGANGTAPYTFTYSINGGSNQTVTTSVGTSVTVAQPTATPGNYTYSLVSVSDANGCSQTQSGTAAITVKPAPTATITGTVTTCQNATAPAITFTGSTATAPYTFTYKINGGANQTVTTTTGNSITIAQSTAATGTFTYTLVSVASANSCSQTQTGSAVITVVALPTATIGGTSTVCQNATAPNITFTGAGGTAPYTFTYKINGGTNQTVTTTSGNSVTVSQPTATAGTFTYTLVSVTSAASCSQVQSGSAVITVSALPTATITGNSTVCQNTAAPNITFTGAGGTAPYTFTYKINSGANQTVSTVSGNSVTVSQATSTIGTFSYTLISVSSATSCSQTQSGTATITVNPLPTGTISGNATVCQNASAPNITFTGAGATAPYTFTYNINGGVNQTVTTTSGNSVTVSQPTTTAGTFTYTLVSVSSATSCSQTQSGTAVITVNPLPTATISGNATVCRNAAAPNITFTGASATAPYTFTYSVNGGTNQTVTTTSGNSVTVSQPTSTTGTFTYTLVSVSSAASCSQVQSGAAVVTVSPLPTATIAGSSTVCQNAAAPNITFTGAGATAPYTFTYSVNGGTNQTVTTTSGNSVTVSQQTTTAGTFTYTLISVSSAASCSQVQSGTAVVTVNPLPTATIAGSSTICQNATAPNITFTGAGATAPYTFIYTINGGANQTITTTSGNSVTVSQPTTTAGTFTYTLFSVSSVTSCAQAQSGIAVITVNPLPTATISGNTTVCRNAAAPNITFTGAGATAPYTFTYSVNGGTNQTVTTTSGNSVIVSQPTSTAGTFSYTLISVSSAASCSQVQSGTAVVTVNPLPTATIAGSSTVCQNAAAPNITFTGAGATAPYTFTFNINGGVNQTVTTTSGNSVTVSQPTTTAGTFTYTLVSVSSATSCSQTQSGTAAITVNQLPTATISGNATICRNAASLNITFTGAGATAPYTFTYSVNGGTNQTVTTTSGNSVTVSQPTSTAGTFSYTLISVSSAASCSQVQSGTAVVTVNPLPTATIAGSSTICQNATAPNITFTGAGATAPYTFIYTINGGANQTITTTSGNSVTVSQPTTTAGTFTYTLVSVSSATSCSQAQSGTAVITVVGTVAAPAFSLGSASSRCQSAASVTYTATATNATAITYSLDGTSTSAGNTIDPTTGTVTYKANWTGTSTVTATATGCNGPVTATHTATTAVAPTASFAYPANPYCSNGTTATASFSGTTGGVFSSAASLSINPSTGTVDITTSTPGIPGTTYTVNYSIPSSGVCPAYSISAPLTINIHAIWNGSVSRNWHDANNWSCGGVPTLTSNARIPTGMPRYPIIYSGVGTTHDITIEPGAYIVDSGALTIAGNIYNSGYINAVAGKVEFATTSAQVISTSLFSPKIIQDIVLSNPAGVTLTGPLRVTGSVSFGNVNNSVFTTGDSLTLASVPTSDAQVKDITNGGVNYGNVISGLMIVERYMPPKRAYRLLTAPVNSTGSIKANWMENSINPDRWNRVNPYPGYGTNITGAGDGANGFDPTQTHNPSVFTYNNQTQAWAPLPNTGGLMSVGGAYRIIVRGDRDVDMNTNTPPPTPTTLRAKGTVTTGNVMLTKSGGGGTPGIASLSSVAGTYNLVANPYASAINWLTTDKTDIGSTIYIFDPNVAGVNNRRGYVAYNSIMGATNDRTSAVDNIIQSGQSFFTMTAGQNPLIRFKETDKATGHRAVFRSGDTDPNISLQLLLPSQLEGKAAADGAKVYFSDQYDNAVSDEDSYKFTNQDENLAILNGGATLCIEGRKPISGADSIQLKLWQLTDKSYFIKTYFNNFSYGLEAYLKDKYLNTVTQLNTGGETVIPVTITSDPASIAPDRYSIVFESFATLPLHLLGIKAAEKNNGIEVGWTAESESNMDEYEVEKSPDGRQFVMAGTVKAKINPEPSSNYTWLDLIPFKGENYYRIKSVDKAGATRYSSIAKVSLGKQPSGIIVFPNPIVGKKIILRFTEVKKGNYSINIFKTSGEKVYGSTIYHSAGSADHSIELTTVLTAGTYYLQIADTEDEEMISILVN